MAAVKDMPWPARPSTHPCTPACLCQDDLLYETLTVNETLMYAARLRLPKDTSYAEKAARVATVVAALGLVKCQDTIIGGFFRRGISGGCCSWRRLCLRCPCTCSCDIVSSFWWAVAAEASAADGLRVAGRACRAGPGWTGCCDVLHKSPCTHAVVRAALLTCKVLALQAASASACASATSC